ncbi:MAG: DUF2169 domain-containing protein [Sandaracinaceae bacterium]
MRPGLRVGSLYLKATFRVGAGGRLQLDDAAPHPIYAGDVDTALGRIPADITPRDTSDLDVVVLACAYAPGGRPVETMHVSLGLGDATSDLVVTGDRVWVGEGPSAQPTTPLSFTCMPLTWSNAYGGTAEIPFDMHDLSARLPVRHAGNPEGKGFNPWCFVDATLITEDVRKTAAVTRRLPNIEDARDRVARWSDDPLPAGWGALPPMWEAHALASGRHPSRGRALASHAALPSLRIEPLRPNDRVELRGCTPDGSWGFAWPALCASFDYELGQRQGTMELRPLLLVLLPDESRFTVTYRAQFRFDRPDPSELRSLRVRVS